MEASQLTSELPFRPKIGFKLRDERLRRNLTVREVARRIGVSPSLVSQIERDKVTPSVSTLWALVTVLGLTMGDLFTDADARHRTGVDVDSKSHGPVTSPGERAALNLESGVHWERLTASPDPLVEFLYVVYPRGSASSDEEQLVRHTGKEYGHVIRGQLGVRIGFDEYQLGPGMSVSFDSSSPHRLWAIGNQPAEAIWVVVGRQGDGPPNEGSG